MVSLGWSASTSQVQGYNVYRGPAPGTYSRINPTLDASTAYSDSNTDLPFLEAVGHPVAVNPDRKLRRVAAQRGWPILEFGRRAA